MDRQTLSIYLHIPFCRVMCSYCAFNTYTDMDALIPAYVEALAREIRIVGQNKPDLSVISIFFGGGTPSLLTARQYEILMLALHDNFDIANNAEISLESNPNDLNYDYLNDLYQVGLNRLSIGMQSSNPRILQLFKREHDAKMVLDAIEAAKQANFDNISLDLIFGIPHQTLDSWRATVQAAIDFEIQNISAYNLILEGNTPLKDDIDKGLLPEPDDDLAADMYDLLTDMLEKTEFEQYEISNWAKSGFESRHNIQYWRNWQYLGLGAGAHGFASGLRYIVMRSPQSYIAALQSDAGESLDFPRTPAVSKASLVDPETDMQETLLMGLRLVKEGIVRARFQKRFAVDLLEHRREAIQKHMDYGLLHVDDERVRLTKAGRFLSNAVIRDLI
jgi:putative oxygen-independent coproporphyrinogen III oxidase